MTAACTGLAILAAACGGNPGFDERAEASCERAHDAGRSLSKPSPLEPFGSPERIVYGEKMVSLFETMLAEMKALTPPATQSATMDRFLDTIDKAVDYLRQGIDVAQARDVRKAERLGVALEANWRSADRFAGELNLSECAFLS